MSKISIMLAAMLAAAPQRESPLKQVRKSTLTKSQQEERARRNKAQKAARKRNKD